MKKLWSMVIFPIIGIAIGFAFYMLYIHVISWLSIPFSIVYGLFIAVILVFALGYFLMNMKDFVVSIFKDNDERDEKGFKKHF